MADFDRDYLPKELPTNAIDAGGGVGYTWGEGEKTLDNLLIWHWCDHHLWREKPGFQEEYMPTPGYTPCGAGAHDFIQAEPLHLEPSIYYPGCCGKHGWIRDGKWTDA